MTPDDDLPEGLQGLFDAERRRPGPPGDAQDRVRLSMLATLGAASGGVVGGASGSAAGGKVVGAVGGKAAAAAVAGKAAVTSSLVKPVLLSALALATLSGVGVALYPRAPAPAPIEAPVVVERPAAPVVVTPPVEPARPAPVVKRPRPAVVRPVMAPVVEAPVVAAPVVVAPVETAPPAVVEKAERERRFARERALLDEAKRAADPQARLAVLERHAQEFPQGALLEERQALRVLALVKAGRAAEAEAEGRAFVARYPSSIYVPVVTAAVERR